MESPDADVFSTELSSLIYHRPVCPYCQRNFGMIPKIRWFSAYADVYRTLMVEAGLQTPKDLSTPGALALWQQQECCRFYLLAAATTKPYTTKPRDHILPSRQYNPSEIDGYSLDTDLRLFTHALRSEGILALGTSVPPVVAPAVVVGAPGPVVGTSGLLGTPEPQNPFRASGPTVPFEAPEPARASEPTGASEPLGIEEAYAVLAELSDEMDEVRSELDQYDSTSAEYRQLSVRMTLFDYKHVTQSLKDHIHTRSFRPLITKAWPKLYQILMGVPNVVPRRAYRQKRLDALFPAEYPGAWIDALRYFVMQSSPELPAVEWLANSYAPMSDKTTTALKKMRGTPKDGVWLMTKDKHDGDLTNPATFAAIVEGVESRTQSDRRFEERSYGSKRGTRIPASTGVDLFLADGGMDISDPADRRRYKRDLKRLPRSEVEPLRQLWNQREGINAPLIIAEMLLSLETLRPGGTAVIKTYTITSEPMVDAFMHWATHYREVVVCKPTMSSPVGAEIYLVGLGFNPAGDTVVTPDMVVRLGHIFHHDRQLKTLRRNNETRRLVLGKDGSGTMPDDVKYDKEFVARLLRLSDGSKTPNRPDVPLPKEARDLLDEVEM